MNHVPPNSASTSVPAILRVQVRPPDRSRASSTVTRHPRALRSRAATKPATPPPITIAPAVCPFGPTSTTSATQWAGTVGIGGIGAGSPRDAAIVIKIAAGTKNIPTDNIPRTQPNHSSTAETIRALRCRTRTGIKATSTGTDTTTRTQAPFTWNMLTLEERVENTPLDDPKDSVTRPVGANAATSAPSPATRNAANVNPLAFTRPAYVRTTIGQRTLYDLVPLTRPDGS